MPTIDELRMLQALPLEVKVAKTKLRIKEFVERYGEDGVYISFSGGKDSTVLLHLVRELYPNIPAVYSDTGLEYPEIRDFVKTFDNVVWLKPKMNFRKVVETYGYPVPSKDLAKKIEAVRRGAAWATKFYDGSAVDSSGRPSRYAITERWKCLVDAPFNVTPKCCDIMKKAPFAKYYRETGRYPFTGTMADESMLRTHSYLKFGCNAFESSKPHSQPMGFWREQDVLHYIKINNIPICSLYGDIVYKQTDTSPLEGQESLFGEITAPLETTGLNRTGCMFCLFGIHLEPEPNRFQQMKITHPKTWEYCLKPIDKGGLGMKEVLDYIGVKYE